MPRNKPAAPGSDSDPAVSADPAQGIAALKYEEAVAELERIVQTMESGDLPLEESIAAYRRGSELLTHCQQQLSDAESKIQVLESGVLRDFDASAGGSR